MSMNEVSDFYLFIIKMIRKNLRLRKEYLYHKGQELKEGKKQEKRIKMQNAIDNEK